MNHASLKHPGRWIWLLFLVPAVIGLARLRLDVEIFNLLPQDLAAVQGLRIHQEHFANARELIITVRGPNRKRSKPPPRGWPGYSGPRPAWSPGCSGNLPGLNSRVWLRN